MASVTEGGYFHQGAAEISAANREDLLEHHRLYASSLFHNHHR